MTIRSIRGASLALMLAATGCGGGDDDATSTAVVPAPAPAPTPTPTPTAEAPARWRPDSRTSWQWQLTGPLDDRHAVTAYDIDLFDTPPATIATLHAAGRRVVCYFSAGSDENWRPDSAAFAASDRGAALDGWAGERWLAVGSDNVRRVMAARLDLAKVRGCDAVEPDNVDAFDNANGLGITAAQQLDYNRFLADEAHRRGLAVGLKNDLPQIPALVGSFDFAINEQCHEYDECDGYAPFLAAGKPVLVVEYHARYRSNAGGARDAMCAASRAQGVYALVLPLALDGSFRWSCDGS